MRHLRSAAALTACAVVTQLAACAGLGVELWQRGTLARDEMQVVSDPLEVSIDEHIYFSKESLCSANPTEAGGLQVQVVLILPVS